ncbi:MAG: dihydrolipoyllysine-residue acetyltransferase [Candidatus Sedimenticola sp. (ex Thyasira tokunagai)]
MLVGGPSVGSEIKVLVPDIGDFSGVEVIEVLASTGDRIEVDQSLATLESDKATMEIPSPLAGTVKEVVVKVGDSIGEGDLLLTLQSDSEAITEESASSGEPPAPAAEEVETAQAPASTPTAEPEPEFTQAQRLPGEKMTLQPPVPVSASDTVVDRTHAGPSVRRFARELGVDLLCVKGSGNKGRITRDDVQAYIKQALSGGCSVATPSGAFQPPSVPVVDFSKFGEIEEQPLSRIKKISGTHLTACWINIPHVTQFDEADITELEAFRQAQKGVAAKQDVKLTFMPFLMKACVGALQQQPEFNSSLSQDGTSLIYKKYFHIGIAVDTPNGLMVPVIRDVDKKGIYDLARELMDVSSRAREGKLSPADLQGGCFSISSLGGIGGTAFTPIVNAPEVAILGVSRSFMKPVWDGSAFNPRLTLPLSLSYDHRVIDGAQAAHFTTLLSGLLTDIRRLLL